MLLIYIAALKEAVLGTLKPVHTVYTHRTHMWHFTFNAPLLGVGVALRVGLCCVLYRAEGVAVSGD